jgi:hypothetical protein
MCWNYKGIDYEYAFEFNVPDTGGAASRLFRIVASNYRKETANFAGLNLDNELEVVSYEKAPFEAFYNIIQKVIDYTSSDERAYAEAHSGRMPSPLLRVKDEAFLKKFEERKNSGQSLEYYEQLKGLFERPVRMSENATNNLSDYDIVNNDIVNIICFLFWVNSKLPDIRDVKAFKI